MNRVILLGRLTKKDFKEIGEKKDKHIIGNLCLAVDKMEKGEKVSDFFYITVWDKKAEFVDNYIEIGKRILLEGYLTVDEYVDSEDKKHKITKIVGTNIEFADSKSEKTEKKKDESEDELPF